MKVDNRWLTSSSGKQPPLDVRPALIADVIKRVHLRVEAERVIAAKLRSLLPAHEQAQAEAA